MLPRKGSGRARDTPNSVFQEVTLQPSAWEAKHPSSLPTGINNFKGHYIHSRDYKDTRDFTDKRVVVIGIGNSGADLAVEISQTAKQVSGRTAVPLARAAPHGTLPAPQGHRDQCAGKATALSWYSLQLAVLAPTIPASIS